MLNVMDLEKRPPNREIDRLIEARKKARAEKNWELADRLREELRGKGVEVQDGRAGA